MKLMNMHVNDELNKHGNITCHGEVTLTVVTKKINMTLSFKKRKKFIYISNARKSNSSVTNHADQMNIKTQMQ